MNKEKALGLIRELSGSVGAALAAYGFIVPDSNMQAFTGLAIVLVSLVYGIRANEEQQVIFSIVRKLISSVAGVLVALQYLTPEKATAIIGILTSLVSIAWSIESKGGINLKGSSMFIFALVCGLSLPSCTFDLTSDPNDGEYRTPFGTVVRQKEDGGAKAVIDGQTVMRWSDWLARIIAGQKPDEILKEQFPVIDSGK